MWRKLRKQIDVERQMLRELLADHQPLLRKCAVSPPDRIELSALAAMLHGFYNGVENFFKRIVVELDETLPRTEGWHVELLEAMTRPGPDRPAVISADLAHALRDYLKFRHFFRGVYPFQLRWERMADLVRDFEATFGRLEKELAAFLAATQDKQ